MKLPSPAILALQHNPKLKPWDYFPGLLYNPGKIFAAIRLRGPRMSDWLMPSALVIAVFFVFVVLSVVMAPDPNNIPIPWDFVWILLMGIGMVTAVPIVMGVALFLVGQMFGVRRLGAAESLSIAGCWAYLLLVMYIVKLSLQMYFGISFSTSPAEWLGLGDNLLITLLFGVLQPSTIYFIVLASIGAMYLGHVSAKRAILLPLATYALTSLAISLYSLPGMIRDYVAWGYNPF